MTRMLLVAIILLVALLGSTPAQAISPPKIDILIISDSTGRGWLGDVAAYSADGGWRGQVVKYLWRTHDIRPVGRTTQAESAAWGAFEAIPNGTAAAAALDLDNVFAALNGDPPEIVIISLGINDGLQASWQIPASPPTIADPITALIEGVAARAPSAEIYVNTIPILNWGDNSTNWSGLYNLYLPVALEHARQHGAQARLIDAVAGMWNPSQPTNFWYLGDPVHPTQAGYLAMAANVKTALEKLSPLLRDSP